MKLKEKNSLPTIFLFGCLIGAAVFILIYGLEPLNFVNDSFIKYGYLEKDVAQHYAGWQLYRNSPWQFPLGVGSFMEYPYGGSVSYTDSIPIFAIIFKAIVPASINMFQYFGLFVFVSYILQGGFAALLVSLFFDNIIFTSLSALLFSLSPVLLDRAFRHCALTAHFLILACLYFYFKEKSNTTIKAFIPFFIINALAITIHPYFLPFTFGIMFAFCLERFFNQKQKLASILSLILSIITTLLIGYIIGAFHVKGGMSELGYGYFSMNLNSYFNPATKHIDFWSKILPVRPVVNGQLEGFNYLGVGVIILTILGIFLLVFYHKNLIISFVKNYFGIIFSTTALLIFAVGNIVVYGGLELFALPFPQILVDKFFGIFRANGRFGTLLLYLIFIFGIYMLTKIKSKNLQILLLSFFIIIQIYDLSEVLSFKHKYFHNQTSSNSQYVAPTAAHVFWEDAIKKVDGVVEMESEQGTLYGNGMIDIAYLCGKNKKFINSEFAARTSTLSRREFLINEKNAIINKTNLNVLYIVEETKLFDSLIAHGDYQAFLVDNQIVVIKTSFTEKEISDYTSLGNFTEIII